MELRWGIKRWKKVCSDTADHSEIHLVRNYRNPNSSTNSNDLTLPLGDMIEIHMGYANLN